jgi:hypothetical protein
VSWRIGDGRILWWAGPTPLTNAGISREGNMNLFLDAMNFTTGDRARPSKIYWDEYFHGQRTSLWSYMEKTPVAWGLLQLAMLSCGILLTYSRRSGPVVIPVVASRLSPLEFVDTLGALYERAGAEPAVVGIVYQRFRALLARHLRFSSTVTDAALDEAVQTRLGWKKGGLGEVLQHASAASRARKLAPAEALALIQELERDEEQLGLKKKNVKEIS